jgi:hypothetical protein
MNLRTDDSLVSGQYWRDFRCANLFPKLLPSARHFPSFERSSSTSAAVLCSASPASAAYRLSRVEVRFDRRQGSHAA